MGSNFFDIPFRPKSTDSDFACKDGEISESGNLTLVYGGSLASDLILEAEGSSGLLSPDIDFGLVRKPLKGWNVIADDFPTKTLAASDPSIEYWTPLALQMLSQFQSDAGGQGMFVAPFYVMGAWKRKDGGYMSPSSPVLMTPNSQVPLVATAENISATELSFRIAGAVCSLYFRMHAPEYLRDLVGIIDSMVILRSSPLHNYGNIRAFLPSRRVTTDNFCRSLNLNTGETTENRVCTETLPLAWIPTTPSLLPEPSGLKYYPFASIPLREVDIADTWGEAGRRGIGDSLFENLEESLLLSETRNGKAGTSTSRVVTLAGQDSDFSLTTRPLKLTVAGAWKTIRRVCLRGNYTPANIILRVYGSRDMLTWWKLSERKGGTQTLLPRSSFRFYRVSIEGYLSNGETLEGVTLI